MDMKSAIKGKPSLACSICLRDMFENKFYDPFKQCRANNLNCHKRIKIKCLHLDCLTWRTNKYINVSQFPGGSSSEMKFWECRLLYCVPVSINQKGAEDSAVQILISKKGWILLISPNNEVSTAGKTGSLKAETKSNSSDDESSSDKEPCKKKTKLDAKTRLMESTGDDNNEESDDEKETYPYSHGSENLIEHMLTSDEASSKASKANSQLRELFSKADFDPYHPLQGCCLARGWGSDLVCFFVSFEMSMSPSFFPNMYKLIPRIL
ncbi:hypothetical protein YC2023_081886 [Brassica napus]